MEWLALWLVCGLIAVVIGARKGIRVVGFVLGFLLGPLGILIVAVLQGNRRQCPSCKELVHPEALVCPHCQRELTPAPDAHVEDVTPSKPFPSRLLGVFIEPGETFEDIARKPDWIAPLVVLILVSFSVVETMLLKIGASQIALQAIQRSGRATQMDPAQLAQIAERSAAVMRIVMPAGAIVGTPVFLLIVAGIGLLILNVFFGQKVKFKHAFSVTCYADMPSILGAVMAISVMVFGDRAAFNPQSPAPTNPGYFMNPLTGSHALFALASSLDVMIFWFMALLAIGLSRVAQKKVKTSTIFITYLGFWVLVVIVKVGFAILFAGH